MAGIPAHILNLYEQYDFIPEAIYNGWAAGGYTIGQIFEWLLVPLQMATAVLAAVGAEATSHASELAHVSIEDYEPIISARDLIGATHHTSNERKVETGPPVSAYSHWGDARS